MERIFTLAIVIIVFVIILFTKCSNFENNYTSYLINLPRRGDRLADFKSFFDASDISKNGLVIIEAVDGADFEQIEAYSPKSTRDIMLSGKRSNEEDLTPGMIGCYLSHYKTYEEFLKTDKTHAFIFEDDGEVHPEIIKNLPAFPPDWDIISLGILNCMECPDIDVNYTRPNKFWGTAGYIISRQGATKMINNRESKISMQIDGFIGKLTKEGKINGYSVKNKLVNVNYAKNKSDVQMNLN